MRRQRSDGGARRAEALLFGYVVAQIANLLCRRLVVGKLRQFRWARSTKDVRSTLEAPQVNQPATQQTASLRYAEALLSELVAQIANLLYRRLVVGQARPFR